MPLKMRGSLSLQKDFTESPDSHLDMNMFKCYITSFKHVLRFGFVSRFFHAG